MHFKHNNTRCILNKLIQNDQVIITHTQLLQIIKIQTGLSVFFRMERRSHFSVSI